MIYRILLLPLLLLSITVCGQQLPQFSQYQFNPYAINPAVAGVDDKIVIKSINRYQWEGLVDAPRTYTLSLTSPLKNEMSGVGAFLFTDIVGPTRRIGLQGSYSYMMAVSSDLTLSMALSGGILQYSIDGDRIGLTDQNDVALQNILGSKTVFDAKVGVYLYSNTYFVGISAPQLAHNKLDIFESNSDPQGFLSNHFYVNGGYNYAVNDNITLKPTFLVKYVNPAPIKIDANIQVEYQEKYWLGGGWRNNDAINVMAGYNWNDHLIVGYAHDFTNSDLKNYSGATHEVMLGLKLNRKN